MCKIVPHYLQIVSVSGKSERVKYIWGQKFWHYSYQEFPLPTTNIYLTFGPEVGSSHLFSGMSFLNSLKSGTASIMLLLFTCKPKTNAWVLRKLSAQWPALQHNFLVRNDHKYHSLGLGNFNDMKKNTDIYRGTAVKLLRWIWFDVLLKKRRATIYFQTRWNIK